MKVFLTWSVWRSKFNSIIVRQIFIFLYFSADSNEKNGEKTKPFDSFLRLFRSTKFSFQMFSPRSGSFIRIKLDVLKKFFMKRNSFSTSTNKQIDIRWAFVKKKSLKKWNSIKISQRFSNQFAVRSKERQFEKKICTTQRTTIKQKRCA